MNDSPTLVGRPTQLSTFPIQYRKLYDLRKKQEAVLWPAEEVSLKDDTVQWRAGLFKNKKQDELAKRLLKHVFIFFNYGDGLVGSNLSKNLSRITIREVLDFYATQSHIEVVHNESYSRINEALIPDEKEALLDKLRVHPAILAKIKWTERWINDTGASIQQNVVAFAIVESIFFSTSFLIIYWIKKFGHLPGVTDYNDQISRDENLHRDFACAVYELVEPEYRLLLEVVQSMICEAVEIETEFIRSALDGQELQGLNFADIVTYIQYIADLLLKDLGYPMFWRAKNPFQWIAMIQIMPKKNFFEKKATEYQKAHTQVASHQEYDFSNDPQF